MKHRYDFRGKGYNYVRAVSRLLGSDFSTEQFDDGVTFIYKDGRRFLKLVDDTNMLLTVFYVPIPSLHKDNPIEVVHFHSAPVPYHEYRFKAIDVDQIYAIIEIALVNFLKN